MPLREPVYGLTRALAGARGVGEIWAVVERTFAARFGVPVALAFSRNERPLIRHYSPSFDPDRHDLEIASLAIASRRPAGRGTNDMPAAASRFLPLSTADGVLGAFGLKAAAGQKWIPRRNWPMVEAFTQQTALALLRDRLDRRARQADILSDSARFQNALLNSVAHNVRTPLATIIGVLSTLQENSGSVNEALRNELIATARDEAQRLNRLLGNLLDLSRLESHALHVRSDLCDIQDIVGAALEQLGAVARNRQIEVNIPVELPFVRMDFVLIVQVLVNLLDNAIKYSPPEGPISVRARIVEDNLEIAVRDRGAGIAEKDLVSVFEKFNRAGRTGETGGIGLGLSICKGLVEAHRGRIWAETGYPCGTTVAFRIPLRSDVGPA
jgi:two-component system, OmpR family, sensor histidine kinase KdpD